MSYFPPQKIFISKARHLLETLMQTQHSSRMSILVAVLKSTLPPHANFYNFF